MILFSATDSRPISGGLYMAYTGKTGETGVGVMPTHGSRAEADEISPSTDPTNTPEVSTKLTAISRIRSLELTSMTRRNGQGSEKFP